VLESSANDNDGAREGSAVWTWSFSLSELSGDDSTTVSGMPWT
jgi:hypothetical protein